MKNEFIEVYVCELLQDIKKCVKNKINLEEKNQKTLNYIPNKVEKVDEKILEVIVDLCLTGNISDEFEALKKHKKLNKKLKKHLILYYTALYFDNVDLLKRLLKNGFNFGKKPKDLVLCALDPELSSAFSASEYQVILERSIGVLEPFYKSIMKEASKDKVKYIKKFASIMRKRADLVFDEEGNKTFIKQALDIFDEETYLKADSSQMNIIANIGSFENPKNIKRLNKMMQERGFTNSFVSKGEALFNYFDDLELEEMKTYVGEVLSDGINSGVDPIRLKRLYNMNNSLGAYRIIYNKAFLDRFDDEAIATFPGGFLSDLTSAQDYYFPDDFNEVNENRLNSLMRIYGIEIGECKGIRQKVKLLLGGK